MATEEQLGLVLSHLSQLVACRWCGTRIRFADVECPHCGADLEAELRAWAQSLVDALFQRLAH